jgi:hypothetical protein
MNTTPMKSNSNPTAVSKGLKVKSHVKASFSPGGGVARTGRSL